MLVHKSSKGERSEFCSGLFVIFTFLFRAAESGACPRETAPYAELAVGIKSIYFSSN
jgi:hypothetical protein